MTVPKCTFFRVWVEKAQSKKKKRWDSSPGTKKSLGQAVPSSLLQIIVVHIESIVIALEIILYNYSFWIFKKNKNSGQITIAKIWNQSEFFFLKILIWKLGIGIWLIRTFWHWNQKIFKIFWLKIRRIPVSPGSSDSSLLL